MKGFGGAILHVDLSSGRIARQGTDPGLARKFIGGFGLNTWLAYQLIRPGVPALAPESPIILGAGVLAGTLAPMSCKSLCTHKCPATGSVATGVGSLSFGPMLKWAGYDHVVVTGKADGPVYLRVFDDDVQVCDAGHIWGKDIWEATDALKKEHGEDCSVVCIGQAGENLVNLSMALIDKNGTFGRSIGANFGSKHLKAVVVKGTKGQQVADPAGFMKLADAARLRGMTDPNRNTWIKGALFLAIHSNLQSAVRSRHQGAEALPLKTEEIYNIDVWDRGCKVRMACPSCLAPDKGVWVVRDGPDEGLEVPMSTPPLVFDSIKYDIEDLNQSLKRWELSNRWGVDSAAFGRLLDFAVGLYEQGVITREDTGGVELKLGYDTFVRLLEMTVKKEGFGALLAEGFNGFIERIGKGCEKYAVQVKGQDLDQDPRGSFGFETFGSAVNFRPGSDLPAGGHSMVGGRPLSYFQYQAKSSWGVPEEAQRRAFAGPEGFDIGYLQPHYESWATVLNCLGLCFRLQSSRLYPVGLCADLYSAATGFDVGPAELLKAADRVWNVGKASNAREGFSRKDDWWPDVYFDRALRFEGKELPLMDYFKKKRISREAFGVLLDHYYEERGWDVESGIPGKEKLLELGLDEVAADLWP